MSPPAAETYGSQPPEMFLHRKLTAIGAYTFTQEPNLTRDNLTLPIPAPSSSPYPRPPASFSLLEELEGCWSDRRGDESSGRRIEAS